MSKQLSAGSNHTPGPWRIDKDELGVDIEGHVPINAKSHAALALVVWHMDDEERSPMCEANAHLVAAAPDLLEALEDLHTFEPDRVDECLACRAIAKAKGYAPTRGRG